jgi:hypothetical protein
LPPTISRVNALCRSGVVLLSSHIEGYIEDFGEVALTNIVQRNLPKSQMSASFRYYLSSDLINIIKQATNPLKVVATIELLLARDGHIWDLAPNFSSAFAVKEFLADFSNPTHKRIRKFFGRFGYDRFENDLAGRLAGNFAACSNMVDQVIEQRNRIAHGDTVTIGTPTDLARMIQLVKVYCRETDSVVGNWFAAKGCPIR